MSATPAPAAKMPRILDRHRVFVVEYLKDMDASKAAVRAGYAPKWADRLGANILRKPHIAALVREEIEARLVAGRISVDRILAEYARLAFGNVGDYLDLQPDGLATVNLGKPGADLAALSEVTVEDAPGGKRVKIKLADKRGALDALAKYRGMLVDRHEITGAGGGPLEIRRVVVDPKAP